MDKNQITGLVLMLALMTIYFQFFSFHEFNFKENSLNDTFQDSAVNFLLKLQNHLILVNFIQ